MSMIQSPTQAVIPSRIHSSASSVHRNVGSSLGRSHRAQTRPAQARWHVWFWRMLRIVLGTVWAAGLLLVGLFIFALLTSPVDHLHGLISASMPINRQMATWLCLAAICSSQFVFMVLVADVVCPGASMFVTGILKAFFASLLLMSLLRFGYMAFVLFHGGGAGA